MAEFKHPDGSITVGYIPEEEKPVNAPLESESAEKPKRGRKPKED